MDKGLLKSLEEYKGRDIYPFHMPGHKRNTALFGFPEPFGLDITEIDGFDNLHSPRGILKKAMERCARLFGAEESCFLVNGSTVGLLSSIAALTRPGDRVLMARNCHRAVYNGILLNRLKPCYLWPDTGEPGISGGIDPDGVERALRKETDIRLVIVTSPTYEGIVSNIEKIAGIVHSRGIPLLVDEAHGAHFGFYKGFPRTAISCGADVVIQSIHKTLPAFTQSALLHMQGSLVDRERIKSYLSIYQTSSPSYLLMAGMDYCVRLIEGEGSKLFENWDAMLEEFYERAARLTNIKVRTVCSTEREQRILGINLTNVYDIDKSKIVIIPGSSGSGLSKILLRQYGLQLEMSSRLYALAMTGAGDRREGFERLIKALEALDDGMRDEKIVRKPQDYGLFERPELVLLPSKAYEGTKTQLPLSEAEGRIAGDYVYPYPPGIPLLVPGERITKETLQLIKSCLLADLTVEGLNQRKEITVLTEGRGI